MSGYTHKKFEVFINLIANEADPVVTLMSWGHDPRSEARERWRILFIGSARLLWSPEEPKKSCLGVIADEINDGGTVVFGANTPDEFVENSLEAFNQAPPITHDILQERGFGYVSFDAIDAQSARPRYAFEQFGISREALPIQSEQDVDAMLHHALKVMSEHSDEKGKLWSSAPWSLPSFEKAGAMKHFAGQSPRTNRPRPR